MDAFDVLDIDAAADVKPAKRKLAEAAPTVAEPPPAKFKPPAELKPETALGEAVPTAAGSAKAAPPSRTGDRASGPVCHFPDLSWLE